MFETYSFKGPAVYDGSKSKDLNVENDTDAKYAATISNGWLASLPASIRRRRRAGPPISPISISCRCAITITW